MPWDVKKQVEIIKLIKFLLKNKRLTIRGVKKLLNSNINSLDDYNSYSLKADFYKKNITKYFPDKKSIVLFLHKQPEASTNPLGGYFQDQLFNHPNISQPQEIFR